MKCFKILSAVILTQIFSYSCFADEVYNHPLTSLESLQKNSVNASVVTYKGFKAIHATVLTNHKSIEDGGCDNCTYLSLTDVIFSNGTIEVDVAGKPQEGAPAWAKGFIGVIFRANTKEQHYEGVYLRPVNAELDNQLMRNHSVQYFSYPNFEWKRLRDEFPGHYETYAPLKSGEWTHMKIEVKDEEMKLYINYSESPSFIVTDLKLGKDQIGTVGLLTGVGSDAYFKNLTITHK
ncbi:DUF1080 domain-containing protein [Vibrio hannami]|uniref:family 16 glycoside hydrolase n=1 Tax=Vibrio hannami TaxID=2717094 RepID=UPI00240FCADB|nr:family 16 glycoside hydrolase [Vibrio hannami]MDG3085541.1 DUF1080 domain-containing protein [Vibrio hannami]